MAPTVAYETVTPALAKEWSGKLHPHQRKLNPRQVINLVKKMNAGVFNPHITHIMFDENGLNVNGHHTLQAMIQSNKTYEIIVQRGLPPSCIVQIDTTRNRRPHERYKAAHGCDITPGEISILKILDTQFSAARTNDQGNDLMRDAWQDEYMNHCHQIRTIWKDSILAYGNGELVRGGKPDGFVSAPSHYLGAAAITATRAYPDQADAIRRWTHIAQFGQPHAKDDQAISSMETLTALALYRDCLTRIHAHKLTMRWHRDAVRRLWQFFEHDGTAEVPNIRKNPFAAFY